MSSSTSASEGPHAGVLAFMARMGLFLLLAVSVLLGCALFGPHVSSADYLGAFRAKHGLLHRTPSPKALVVGGSNAAFGVDSEALEEALCMPVVNMGLHASLGFRFMVAEVEGRLGPGDVVIVSLEYSNFARPDKREDVLNLVVDRCPEALAFVPPGQRAQVVLGTLVMRLQAAWRLLRGQWGDPDGHPLYRADGFNECGDMVRHLDLPAHAELLLEPDDPGEAPVDPAFAPIARRLVDRAETAGAIVLFTWPCLARSGFEPHRATAVRTELERHGFHLIGTQEEVVLPDSAFHDTRYHPRAWGRAKRTAVLAREVCMARSALCCPK